MSAPVTVNDDGAVRIVRLNRPEKKNALTLAMYGEMTRALREAEQNAEIRCSVIAGNPELCGRSIHVTRLATNGLTAADAISRARRASSMDQPLAVFFASLAAARSISPPSSVCTIARASFEVLSQAGRAHGWAA